jgi:hypothetical protein
MSKKYKDIEIGDVYGRWTVIEKGKLIKLESNKKIQYWICQCSCQNKTIKPVSENNLLYGKNQSCGCLKKEKSYAYTYDYVKGEFDKRGYILLTTEFTDIKQKLQFICPIHKEKGIQKIDFSHFYFRNQGCKYCGVDKSHLAHRTDIGEIKRVTEEKGFIFVEAIFNSKKAKVLFICPQHTEKGVQETDYFSMKKNTCGCKYCLKQIYSTEEFIKEMSQINVNITIIGEYVNNNTNIECMCNIHKNTWYPRPADLRSGKGCHICASEKLRQYHLKTHDERVLQLEKINPNILLRSDYIDGDIPCTFYCKIHGKEWLADNPSLVFYGVAGCPICGEERFRLSQRKSHEEFVKEMYEKHPHIKVLGIYETSIIPIEFYCTQHNFKFLSTPANMLINKNGCPQCQPHHNENKLGKILENWNLNYVKQFKFDGCKDKRKLPFDYYLTEFNILVEYDGEDHYLIINRNGRNAETSVNKLIYTQNHDQIKNKYCKNNNIPLIRIPYWERDNMEYFLFDQLIKYRVIEEINIA